MDKKQRESKDRSALLAVLQGQVDKLGSKRAVATHLQMTESRFGRILSQPDQSLSVLGCLRLSELTDDPPSHILRIAGKGDVADLIEKLYAVGKSPVSGTERELVDQWRLLNTRARESLSTILVQLATGSKKAAAKKTA